MEKLIGFGIIAAIAILYIVVKIIRGEADAGEMARVFIGSIIVGLGSLVIPVFAILILGWVGGIIVSIISIVISFIIGIKIMKG